MASSLPRNRKEVDEGVAEILAWLRSQQEQILAFTSLLVATPSPTPPGDERAVAGLIVDHLNSLGLNDITIAAMKPERPNVLCFIGKGQGGRRPSLVLNGHIDTKPAGDAAEKWESDPLTPTIRDDKLYGLGTTDMKGAIAAMVYAGAAVARLGTALPGELKLAFSADEEGGSTFGGKFLAHDYGLRADAVIVCEPSGITQPWEFIAPVARGICCFKIKVSGTQMHSSLSDQLPSVNASVKAAEVLARMSRELEIQAPDHPLCPDGITINLGVTLHGGVTYGVYPGYAEFGVDLRTVPGMTQENVERDVEAFLDQLRREDPELDVTLAFEPLPVGWTPPCQVPADSPVIRAAQAAASRVLGAPLPLRALPAVTDGSHFAACGIPTIPAFGPGLLPLAHSPNEYIHVENLLQAAQIYALTTLNFMEFVR